MSGRCCGPPCRQLVDADALVCDAGFEIRQLQEAGATRYVVRAAKNVTGRRAGLADYPGRGRPRERGELIRPLARTYRGRELAATAPDHVVTWQEGDAVIRAEWWDDLVLPDVPLDRPTFRLVVIHDPRWTEPLVLATTLAVSARALRDLYLDRWPVEQLPLAAKQMLGAARAFVSAPETCQRLPELALLAGSILTYLAATLPAIPTGSWDRRPRPTPGRLRRRLAHTVFPTSFPLPDRIRQKAAVTAHLPKGFWGQRRRSHAHPRRFGRNFARPQPTPRSPELPETKVLTEWRQTTVRLPSWLRPAPRFCSGALLCVSRRSFDGVVAERLRGL